MGSNFNLDSYFERIEFKHAAKADLWTLCELHKQHVFTIPFENLDIHFGNPISLDPSKLFQKLISEKRGGYCFELNGLFQLLLENLGFDVYSASGRVLFDSEEVPPRSHRLLIINVEKEQWLVDVGFGAFGLLEPIPLKVGVEYRQHGEVFKLDYHQKLGFIFKTRTNNNWISQYAFGLEQYLPIDFMFPNYYHSHSPESIFCQKKICQLPTPEGRKKLVDMKLSVPVNGQTIETVAQNENEFISMLKMHFNIEILRRKN
jgi:N-hydroxyarylamine O-acetyltransferase